MKILVDGMAWINKAEMSDSDIKRMKEELTIVQRISKEYAERSTPATVHLWVETDKLFGIPREYFFDSELANHDVSYNVSMGNDWPGDISLFDSDKKENVVLKPEQVEALAAVKRQLGQRPASGALVQCPTGWGKTVLALAVLKEMKVKTAVLVHREFLLNQWRKRIERFLPDAKIGQIYGKKWEVDDCHVVLVMVQTISSWVKRGKVRPELGNMFGMVMADEVHRMGAPHWGLAIPEFKSAYRVGVSAAPKRSDGLDKVFFYHIGRKAYTGVAISMIPKIKRVWTTYEIKHPRLNVGMLSMEMAFKMMSADAGYNQSIIDQLKLALTAGRKIIVYSHTVVHLERLKEGLEAQYKEKMTASFYIGGMKEDELSESEKANVIFATLQMAKDSLDIPTLDTVLLAAPVRNPQQPAGRACREYPGKKEPIIIDMRADNVPIFRDYGDTRDRMYEKLYGSKISPVEQGKLPGVGK